MIKSPSLLSANTESETALGELTKIKTKFQKSLDKIETYRGYEEILNIEKRFKLEELKKFEESFSLRDELWQNRNEFKKDKKEWFDGFFKQQDSEATVAKIKKYNKTCQLIKATRIPKGTSDDVLEQLFSEVVEVMKLTSLIGALGVTAMKQRHWIKVFDLLKEVPPSSLDTMTL